MPLHRLTLALAPLLLGCATERDLSLYYPPVRPAVVSPVAVREAHVAPAPAALWIENVVDARPADAPLARRRNVLAFRTGYGVSDDDPGEWVHQALAVELDRAGFRLVDRPDPELQDTRALEIRLLEAQSSLARGYHGRVLLELTLRTGPRIEQRSRHLGQVLLEPAEEEVSDPYAEALSRALQDAVSQAVASLAP